MRNGRKLLGAGVLFIIGSLFVWGCGGGSCDESAATDPTATGSVSGQLNQQDCAETGLSASESAAASLTKALAFNNAGAEFIPGAFPGDVSTASPQGEVTLGPGGSTTVSTPAANPDDPDDPVVASLVWMDGSDGFITLPSGGADSNTGGTLDNTFTVDPSVCDNLCDIVHDIKCYEAAQTASGVITAANLTTVLLECTGNGDPAQCPGGGSLNMNSQGDCSSYCNLALGCFASRMRAAGEAVPSVGDCVAECQMDADAGPIIGCLNANNVNSCSQLQTNPCFDL